MSLKLIAYLVGCGGVLAFVSWLYFKGVHDEHARMQPRLDAATAQATINANTATALDNHQARVAPIREKASHAERLIRQAPTADQPLDPGFRSALCDGLAGVRDGPVCTDDPRSADAPG